MRISVTLALLAGCSPMMMTPDAGPTMCSSSNKTPPNLATNAQFECDGAEQTFTTLATNGKIETSVMGRSGRGLKLTVGTGAYASRFSSAWKIPVTANGTYCLTAFMKSDLAGTELQLWAANKTNQVNKFTLPGPATAWSRVPPSIVISQAAQSGDEIFVGVDHGPTVPNPAAGAVIELDDIDVWLSADGRCQEAR